MRNQCFFPDETRTHEMKYGMVVTLLRKNIEKLYHKKWGFMPLLIVDPIFYGKVMGEIVEYPLFSFPRPDHLLFR